MVYQILDKWTDHGYMDDVDSCAYKQSNQLMNIVCLGFR